jgi:hypothetical protein
MNQKGDQRDHSSTSGGVNWIDSLLAAIPKLKAPIHLIAFLAVVGVVLLEIVTTVSIQLIIFIIGVILLLIIFVHAPTFLKDRAVIIVFLIGMFLCFLAALAGGIYVALAATATNGPQATWQNDGKQPLGQLITPVNAREGYDFSFSAIPSLADAETRIKSLVLMTPIKIRKNSFAEVFQELARLNEPCLTVATAGQRITITLDTRQGRFVRKGGYDICERNHTTG